MVAPNAIVLDNKDGGGFVPLYNLYLSAPVVRILRLTNGLPMTYPHSKTERLKGKDGKFSMKRHTDATTVAVDFKALAATGLKQVNFSIAPFRFQYSFTYCNILL